MQFLYQNQKTDIVRFELSEDDFTIHLNKENLMTEGRQLIELFLCTLQTYKSSGAAERAQNWYNHYSEVDVEMEKIRDIVMKKKGPGRLCLYSNLTRYSEGEIHARDYASCFEGIIHSYADRYPWTMDLHEQIMSQWTPTKDHLRVQK